MFPKGQKGRLSNATTKRQQLSWARLESEKVRLLLAYFIRLCKRAEWSHNSTVARLKMRFMELHSEYFTKSKSEESRVEHDQGGEDGELEPIEDGGSATDAAATDRDVDEISDGSNDEG